MSDEPAAVREKWDSIYRAAASGDMLQPARVLTDYAHLLPAAGSALDLACGLGGNALFLAGHGLAVCAWDISAEAILRVRALAARCGAAVQAEERDVVRQPPAPATFDVIVVSRFLERGLAGPLMAALRLGGLLYYQTYLREKTGDAGPRNPAYLLAPNELLSLFRPLRVLAYREEGLVGDTARGFRNEALFVGRKS